MREVWKFRLSPCNNLIKMPCGAVVLTAREQFDQICIWAEVIPSEPKEERFFEVFQTGQDMPGDMGIDRKYIGTAMLDGGAFVLHVYERV